MPAPAAGRRAGADTGRSSSREPFSGSSPPGLHLPCRWAPHVPCRQPLPRPRLRRRVSLRSTPASLARASCWLSIRFCRHPPPHPRLCRDTLRLLPGHPHPARAFGAPPPPPGGGGVRAWRYLVGSRIRGVAGGPPCPVSLRDLPMCWTVGISPLGVGPTGRGNSFPLPCLSRSNHLASRRSHPSLWQGIRIPRRQPYLARA